MHHHILLTPWFTNIDSRATATITAMSTYMHFQLILVSTPISPFTSTTSTHQTTVKSQSTECAISCSTRRMCSLLSKCRMRNLFSKRRIRNLLSKRRMRSLFFLIPEWRSLFFFSKLSYYSKYICS
jgi:hypothetical protein